MNAMTEIKPMFEVGKTYNCCDGHKMKITRITAEDMTGEQTDGDPMLRHRLLYNLNGRAQGYGWGSFTLLPGAIEDEPNAVDPLCVLQGQIDQLSSNCAALLACINNLTAGANAQTTVIAGMAAKIQAMADAQAIFMQTQTSHDERIKTLGCRIDLHTQPYPGLASAKPEWPAPGCLPEAKPTIKGGWVNVWRGSDGVVLGPIYADRAIADLDYNAKRRIACIQIPDVTEGEGL